MPLRAHIYMRSIAAVWGRYRQEWSYYLHTVPESDTRAEPIATPFAEANGDEALIILARTSVESAFGRRPVAYPPALLG